MALTLEELERVVVDLNSQVVSLFHKTGFLEAKTIGKTGSFFLGSLFKVERMHNFPTEILRYRLLPFFGEFDAVVEGTPEAENSFSVQENVISFLADKIEEIDPLQNIETVLNVEGLNIFDGWCELTWLQAKILGDFFANTGGQSGNGTVSV
jgi:hypothetical protein